MNDQRNIVNERLAQLAAPAYVVALLLVLTPLADFLSGVWPWRPAAVDWRFASIGLLSGFLLTPLLGTLIAVLIASVRGDGRVLRGIGVFALIMGVMCTTVLLAFILDALQLNSRIPQEQRRAFLDASVKAFLKHATASAAFYLLGIRALRLGSWKVPRRMMADRGAIVIDGGQAAGESPAS